MFKIIALAGLLTGGAGYATYEYTDLFGSRDGCPLSNKSCCPLQTQPVAVTPSCCQTGAECCEVVASCCDAGSTARVAAKTSCCQIGADCCEVSAACCGATNATAAVAGPAVLVSVKATK